MMSLSSSSITSTLFKFCAESAPARAPEADMGLGPRLFKIVDVLFPVKNTTWPCTPSWSSTQLSSRCQYSFMARRGIRGSEQGSPYIDGLNSSRSQQISPCRNIGPARLASAAAASCAPLTCLSTQNLISDDEARGRVDGARVWRHCSNHPVQRRGPTSRTGEGG